MVLRWAVRGLYADGRGSSASGLLRAVAAAGILGFLPQSVAKASFTNPIIVLRFSAITFIHARAHLREINSAETQARDQNVDAVASGLWLKRRTACAIASGL